MIPPRFSVIIALYNAEFYIINCIKGLLEQSLQDWELLLIDDGSTDGTARICDELAKKDVRIRVFHEQHQGVSHARQVGINNVRGEYTIHVDVDDAVSPTMLDEMYQAAKNTNADMLICDYTELNGDGSIYHSQKPSDLTKENVANGLIEGKLYGALWNKLIRTVVFRDNQIRFHKELKMREDMFFLLDVLPYVERIAYLPKAFYTYNRTNNRDSLSNTYLREDRNYFEQEILWHIKALSNSLISHKQRSRLRNSLLNDAYITLKGDIYTKEGWNNVFAPFQQEILSADKSYKSFLVNWALNGHYLSASVLRRVLAFLGKKK